MAWLRAGDMMVDINEAVHIDYVPGIYDGPEDSWRQHRRAQINVLLRNGKEVFTTFNSEEEGRNTFELLFRHLMPEIAQALEEAQNGSRSGPELGVEGVPSDPHSPPEILEGHSLRVHDSSGVRPERL